MISPVYSTKSLKYIFLLSSVTLRFNRLLFKYIKVTDDGDSKVTVKIL